MSARDLVASLSPYTDVAPGLYTSPEDYDAVRAVVDGVKLRIDGCGDDDWSLIFDAEDGLMEYTTYHGTDAIGAVVARAEWVRSECLRVACIMDRMLAHIAEIRGAK